MQIASLFGTLLLPARWFRNLSLGSEMENSYAEIAYVELKRDIHVPIEWPISEMKQLIICFAEKIIKDGPWYILQINEVPAKLICSESNCVYTFQKIPQE